MIKVTDGLCVAVGVGNRALGPLQEWSVLLPTEPLLQLHQNSLKEKFKLLEKDNISQRVLTNRSCVQHGELN